MGELMRIEPAAVPGYFRALDLTPVAGSWAGENCVCLLVALVGCNGPHPSRARAVEFALAVELEVVTRDEAVAAAAAALGLEPDYISGLLEGWDDFRWVWYPCDSPSFEAGWRDGRDAGVACGVFPTKVRVV